MTQPAPSSAKAGGEEAVRGDPPAPHVAPASPPECLTLEDALTPVDSSPAPSRPQEADLPCTANLRPGQRPSDDEPSGLSCVQCGKPLHGRQELACSDACRDVVHGRRGATPVRIETPDTVHGRLLEAVHISGYTFERACSELEWLLEEDRWKQIGGGFSSINDFLATINLSEFRIAIDQRKKLAKKLASIEASQRATARALGVDEGTVRGDLSPAENSAPTQPNSDLGAEEDSPPRPSAENSAPPPFDTTPDGGKRAAERGTAEQQRKGRAQENEKQRAEIAAYETTLPEKVYRTIVIDPPWPMKKINRDVRPNQVGFDYPTMSEAELAVFPVPDMAAEGCHLFLWTTHKFLPVAFRLLDAWSFRYVCAFVWHKPGGFQPVGLPQYNCEFALYARYGTPKFVDTKQFSVCFQAPRREHSRKPDEFYEMVSRVCGAPRIDVFSREPREGFDQYGNEAGKFAEGTT